MLLEPSPGGKFRLLILVVEPGGPGLEVLSGPSGTRKALTLNLVLVPALAHLNLALSALSTMMGRMSPREGKLAYY